ncbi:MAG: hypothetical protein ABEK84_09190 [Salinibacter sp.]
MPFSPGFFSVLHQVVLGTFVGVTALSLLVAVERRARLRRPLLAWHRSGPFTRLPLGPVLFLILVAVGIGHAWFTGRPVPPIVLVGYPAGGVFWGLATWILRSVVVTDYGIVPDLTGPNQAVVWSRIVDYAVTTRGRRPHFVFFYRDDDGDRCRLDLSVPRPHAAALREIVGRKLDDRFSVPDEEVWDDEVLDRLDDRIDLP